MKLLLLKVFYELPVTLKCLFLTMQDILKGEGRKIKTEGKL